MVRLDFGDIKALGESGAYGGELELSSLSCALLLSALDAFASHEWNWVDSDTEWDGIEAALSNAANELMGAIAANGGIGEVGFVILLDKKAQNVGGGTFTTGARRTRALNDEVDPSDICTLTDDEFVLTEGTYLVLFSVPCHRVGKNQSWLRNVTAAEDLIIGSSERAFNDTEAVPVRSHGVGIIDVAAAQTLRIEHRCELSFSTTGFGYPANLDNEIYSQVVIIGIE